MGGWVYLMTNRRNGTLYAGVTSDLPRRAYQHREGLIQGFTKRYGLKMLVYYEQYDDIRTAIAREKAIKHWPRAWKVRLIHAMNPEWKDLYDESSEISSIDALSPPSCPRLSRGSTSWCGSQVVDGRDNPRIKSEGSHDDLNAAGDALSPPSCAGLSRASTSLRLRNMARRGWPGQARP
jgi:putative endonuclease